MRKANTLEISPSGPCSSLVWMEDGQTQGTKLEHALVPSHHPQENTTIPGRGVTSPAQPPPSPRDLPQGSRQIPMLTTLHPRRGQARPPLSTLASDPRNSIISSKKAFQPTFPPQISIHSFWGLSLLSNTRFGGNQMCVCRPRA